MLAIEVSHGRHGALLDEDADVIRTIGIGEVPVLLALVRNGVGGANHIEGVVVDKRAAGLRGDVGELAEVLILGLLIRDVKDLGGNHVAQVDLEALVLASGGIEQAITHDVLLDAALQLAAILNGLKLGVGRAGGAATAANKTKAGDGSDGGTEGCDELTARDVLHGIPLSVAGSQLLR